MGQGNINIVTPPTWTRAKGYPIISGGTAAGITLVDQYYTVYNLFSIFQVLPSSGTPWDQDNAVKELRDLKFQRFDIQPTDSKGHAFITLTYGISESAIDEDDDDPKYFLNNNSFELPLERNAGYRTKWNYDLYFYADGSSYSQPAWWDTATDRSDATGTEKDGEYLWDTNNPGGLWKKVEERQKPGTESYIVPAPVVEEHRWYKDQTDANTAASTVGTLVTPANVFGVSGGEWLVVSANVEPDDRRWRLIRRYQWAKDWDNDLYS